MRDRLIELLDKQSCPSPLLCDKNCKYAHLQTCYAERVADYLLANGVIVPPCKMGDKVFYVNEVCDENANEYLDISAGEVISFSMQKEGLWMYCRYEDGLTYWHLVADDFGKTVFLTKEEAEQALGERGGE